MAKKRYIGVFSVDEEGGGRIEIESEEKSEQEIENLKKDLDNQPSPC